MYGDLILTGVDGGHPIEPQHIAARWLRDHGDDASSINQASRQRVMDTFAIDRQTTAIEVRVDQATLATLGRGSVPTPVAGAASEGAATHPRWFGAVVGAA